MIAFNIKMYQLNYNEIQFYITEPVDLSKFNYFSKGSIIYLLNEQLHREDGPAVEYPNGAKQWYINDQLHREDGPAVEYSSGRKEWYINGKLIDPSKNSVNELKIKLQELLDIVNEMN